MSIGAFFHVSRTRAFENKEYFYKFNLYRSQPVVQDPQPAPSSSLKHLVIIGGGFAGVALIQELCPFFKITLIEPKKYFEATPSLPRVLVEPAQQAHIQASYTDIFSYLKNPGNVTFVRDRVTEIDGKANTVKLRNDSVIAFDFLVISSGSSYTSPIKVSSEDNEKKKLVDNSVFESLKARRDVLLKTSEEIKKSNHVLVLGGGPVGVELASEIISKFPKKQVTLATNASMLLVQLPESARKYAETWFKSKKNATILMNEKFNHIPVIGTTDVYQSESGLKIQADLILRMVGIKPNTDFMQPLMSAWLSEKKTIKVNSHLRLNNHPNIFAIGDCSDFPEEKMAYTAHTQASYVAKALMFPDISQAPYVAQPLTMLVSLGPDQGISVVNGNYLPSPSFVLARAKVSLNKFAIHNVTGCYPNVPFAEKRCFTCRFLTTFLPN